MNELPHLRLEGTAKPEPYTYAGPVPSGVMFERPIRNPSMHARKVPAWERQIDHLFHLPPAPNGSALNHPLLTDVFEPMILRELIHRGIVTKNQGYDARLIGWVEVV